MDNADSSTLTSTSAFAGFVKRSAASTTLLIYVLLAVIILSAGLVSPGFLTLRHLMDIIKQATPLILVTLGQAVVMLIGNVSLDLSVESAIVLTNVVCTTLFTRMGVDPLWLMVILFTMGVTIGLVNGIGTAILKIEPLIMTLGMMIILRGVALIVSGGTPGGRVPEAVVGIVKARVYGVVPLVAVLCLVVGLFLHFVLSRTSFGRKIYLVGSNPRVAYISGINPIGIKIIAYVICSTLAILAGLELTGYIGTGSVIIGGGYSFLSITAAVIGGISFSGGIGNMVGPIGGALIMTVIMSMLTAINIPQAGRFVLQGIVILFFVTIYSLRDRGAG
jgi:ribose transport system permease protein